MEIDEDKKKGKPEAVFEVLYKCIPEGRTKHKETPSNLARQSRRLVVSKAPSCEGFIGFRSHQQTSTYTLGCLHLALSQETLPRSGPNLTTLSKPQPPCEAAVKCIGTSTCTFKLLLRIDEAFKRKDGNLHELHNAGITSQQVEAAPHVIPVPGTETPC